MVYFKTNAHNIWNKIVLLLKQFLNTMEVYCVVNHLSLSISEQFQSCSNHSYLIHAFMSVGCMIKFIFNKVGLLKETGWKEFFDPTLSSYSLQIQKRPMKLKLENLNINLPISRNEFLETTRVYYMYLIFINCKNIVNYAPFFWNNLFWFFNLIGK